MNKKKNRSNLERLLDFIRLTHRFQNKTRMVRKTGKKAWENNAEHTYQLELVCLYLIDTLKLNLDRYKVLMYAKVHDWPELYTEDECDHCELTDSPSLTKNKGREEREAVERLRKDLPEFTLFHEFLENYEKLQDSESIFVYSVDKLIAFWNIVIDEGLTWKQFNTSLDELIAWKEKKIRRCPIGSKLFDELLVLLRNKHGELFGSSLKMLPIEQLVPMPENRIHRLRPDKLSVLHLDEKAKIPA